MLRLFITSRVRRKIIIVFARFPDYQDSIRGVARLINEDVANVHREIDRLSQAGFLKSKKVKNTKVHQVNRDFPLFKDIHSLVLKSQKYDQSRFRRSSRKSPD